MGSTGFSQIRSHILGEKKKTSRNFIQCATNRIRVSQVSCICEPATEVVVCTSSSDVIDH